jgi:hypothetical protein
MKRYILHTLQAASFIWIALMVGVILSSVLYALLSVAGASESISLSLAFIFLLLILLGLLFIPKSFLNLSKHNETFISEPPLPVEGHVAKHRYTTTTKEHYIYDVAISYALEDRKYAEALVNALRHQGLKVFYDNDEMSSLWGKSLYTYLSDIYQNKTHYFLMLVSKHYTEASRPDFTEAQAHAIRELIARGKLKYILSIRLDNTQLPPDFPTSDYLDWHQESAESIADAIEEKLAIP